MNELNDTAHKLLDVAEHFTQTRGFNAFSYRDLQREVGVKTSSIHYYFPAKQDLALSMVSRFLEKNEDLLAGIASEYSTGLEQLEALSQSYIQVLKKGKFCICGMLASDIEAMPEEVNEKLQIFFKTTGQWLADAIELGKKQGEIKNSIQAEHAASLFLATLEGGMLIARTQGNTKYLEAVVQQALMQLRV